MTPMSLEAQTRAHDIVFDLEPSVRELHDYSIAITSLMEDGINNLAPETWRPLVRLGYDILERAKIIEQEYERLFEAIVRPDQLSVVQPTEGGTAKDGKAQRAG